MRLIGVENLKGNEIIGRDIVCENGVTLLRRGTRYRPIFKDKLLDLNILEIYVDDEISKGIEPESIISSVEKDLLVSGIKEQFSKATQNLTMDAQRIHYLSDTLIEKVYVKDVIIDIMDIQRNDDYTYEHCLNVAILTAALCQRLGIPQDMSQRIIEGALIHDLGKIIIPRDILNKKSSLTHEEERTIQTHAELGYSMIKDNPEIDAITKVIVLCHHERQDGSGYPLGKKDDLHIAAKVVAACDVFDALVSNRPHRKGYPINQSMLLFKQEKLDPVIKETFEKMIAFYPVGSTVLLNNGYIGIVEKNYIEDLNRPAVKLVFNTRSKTREDSRLFLLKNPHIEIVGKLNNIPGLDD